MAEYDTKSVLLELLKDGENKTCIDCQTPQPQWASLSFGVFVCLTCSGAHRGLGVHISFVRSLTMDKWTETQVTKMRVGGNAKCREFFEASPNYDKNMSIADKYTAYFATQYKDKLLAEIEGRIWTPSDTPPPTFIDPSSQLRKPRSQLSRTNSPIPRSSTNNSPSYNSSSNNNGGGGGIQDQKSKNEDYFATMGSTNDSRSSDLPPSQGGRYGGFGSDNSYNGSGSSSSGSNSNNRGGTSIPSMDDLRDDPGAALAKGWGFFSNALSQASKSINESVVQPTLERATDPNLQSQFSSYLSSASSAISNVSQKSSQVISKGLSNSSEVIRRDLGYNVGDLGANFVGKLIQGNGDREEGGGRGGYGVVGTFISEEAMEEGEAYGTTTTSKDNGDDFFSGQMMGGSSATTSNSTRGYSDNIPPAIIVGETGTGGGEVIDSWAKMAPNSAARGSSGRTPSPAKVEKKEEWDDWN